MAGIFGLSCNIEKRGSFSNDLFLGTFYQQHFDEDWAGLAVWNGEEVKVDNKPGLFKPNFEEKLNEFQGTEGIGYCGTAKEPLRIDTKIGKFCLCFSGNILNSLELKEKLKKLGVSFRGRIGDRIEIEVIANLIAQGKNVVDGIGSMTKKIKGTYTLLILTEKGIFAARSPDGHWPLVIGEKEGEVAVASSSAGFSNLGLEIRRELKPGEVISMKNGRWKRKETMPSKKPQICSFLWVYSDFPSGVLQGVSVSSVRKKLGAALAQQDIKEGFIPDIVAPIPDSGKYHVIGYKQEFDRQINERKIERGPLYDEVLLKYPYAGRSFTPQKEEKRKKEADIKILPSSESYQGKVVVIVDDSIVRGTQTRTNLVPKLKLLGIKEIHLRIANPELLSHCSSGKTTKKGECLAPKMPSIKKRTKFLGVKSLKYNTIDDLVEAIGFPREQLCVDCSLPEK